MKLGPRVLSVGVEILVEGCAETPEELGQNFGYSRFGITQNDFNKHTQSEFLGSCRINIPPCSPSMSLVQSRRWVIDWTATIGESNGAYSLIMFLISA